LRSKKRADEAKTSFAHKAHSCEEEEMLQVSLQDYGFTVGRIHAELASRSATVVYRLVHRLSAS
jgi:hypothetical protein